MIGTCPRNSKDIHPFMLPTAQRIVESLTDGAVPPLALQEGFAELRAHPDNAACSRLRSSAVTFWQNSFLVVTLKEACNPTKKVS